MYENDSLLEIAIELMEKKRKPHTLTSIAKEAFEMKNIKISDTIGKEALSQFAIDFMLSGYFICCGEDKKGNKLWDLKSRQPHEYQDKEGIYLEDIYEDDEDVKKNELKDDSFLPLLDEEGDTYSESEEDDEEDDEKDDIEVELGMDDLEKDLNIKEKFVEEEEEEEDSYDDEEN